MPFIGLTARMAGADTGLFQVGVGCKLRHALECAKVENEANFMRG